VAAVVAGAEVTLVDSGGKLYSTTTAGDDGTFGFDGLAPGAYRVTAQAGGLDPALVEVEVGEGDFVTIDITLNSGKAYAVGGAVAISSPLDELISHYDERVSDEEGAASDLAEAEAEDGEVAVVEEADDAEMAVVDTAEPVTAEADYVAENVSDDEPAAEEEADLPESARHLPELVEYEDADSVRRALAAGDLVDATNEFGETALMLAADEPELVEILLREGASIYSASRFGTTPLMYALQDRSNESLTLLLKAGADPNAADKDGVTALMMAAIDGNDEAVRKLVRAGADLRARDAKGESVLDYASRSDNDKVARRLRRAGAR
jgi:hypothetical protein